MMRTASRTTASLSDEKKRNTRLRCQLGREVGEALAIAMDGHFPRELRDVQRESLKVRNAALRRPRTAFGTRELTADAAAPRSCLYSIAARKACRSAAT